MMATAMTTNELATDEDKDDGLPTRRRGGRRGHHGGVNNLSSSFNACSLNGSGRGGGGDTEDTSDDPKDNNDAATAPPGTPPKRRPSSRRSRAGSMGSRLCSSLQDRGTEGIARTEGRLSVSFSDQRGLSGATIADILSGSGLDPPEPGSEPEKSLKELMEEQDEAQEGRDSLGKLTTPNRRRSRHMQLTTIISQRSMKFSFDPNEDLDNSTSDKE